MRDCVCATIYFSFSNHPPRKAQLRPVYFRNLGQGMLTSVHKNHMWYL